MKMTITKAKAIEAIETEPVLRAGSWFRRNGSNIKTCEVCAVGSVLRKHCFTTKTKDPGGAIGNMDEMIENNYIQKSGLENNASNAYLANLSCIFEWHAMEIASSSPEMRDLLIHEICATWPDSFEIEFEV